MPQTTADQNTPAPPQTFARQHGRFVIRAGTDYDIVFEHRVIPGNPDHEFTPDVIEYTVTAQTAAPKLTEADVRQFFREQLYDALAEQHLDPFPPSRHFPSNPTHDIAESVIELMLEAYYFGAAS